MKLTNIFDLKPDKYYAYYFSNSDSKTIRIFKCLDNPIIDSKIGEINIRVKEYHEIQSLLRGDDRQIAIDNAWDGCNYVFDEEDEFICIFWELTDFEIINHVIMEDI